MAIFTPSESPAVVVKEIDLTSVVPNVQSTTGAFVGNFRWGPVEDPVKIDNEATLASVFATPSDSSAIDYLSAAYFLRYSGALQVVREVTEEARSAVDVTAFDSAGGHTTIIKNDADFESQELTLAAGGASDPLFVAKYPGSLGNSLKVSYCPVSTSDSAFDNWAYTTSFDQAPGTSSFAASRSSSNDEIHVVVVDEDGLLTGTIGQVVETYPYVSVAADAKNEDGSSNFYKDVINARSRYIWATDADGRAGGNWGENAADAVTFDSAHNDAVTLSFVGGVNSTTLGTQEYATGFDLFEDKDVIEIDFLIAPGMNARVDQTTIVNDLVGIAQQTRKDCVVVTSPARSDIVNNSDPVGSAVTTANTFTSSSYLVVDNNYLKVYDKYNDKYRFIPAASSTAGIMAASDLNFAPWYSPAGSRRGQLLGITGLSYTPTKSQRDTLYKAGINPIANIPGQGVLLYGDKTKLGRPSAFDRINVRRLFLVIERAIARAAESTLFEFNDEFTRAEFVNIVEPFLRNIKGRRGITDFRVVCDETNNTADVIDRNEFIASIFIKPARSINYITLNFVGVRTGVDFDEVVGLV